VTGALILDSDWKSVEGPGDSESESDAVESRSSAKVRVSRPKSTDPSLMSLWNSGSRAGIMRGPQARQSKGPRPLFPPQNPRRAVCDFLRVCTSGRAAAELIRIGDREGRGSCGRTKRRGLEQRPRAGSAPVRTPVVDLRVLWVFLKGQRIGCSKKMTRSSSCVQRVFSIFLAKLFAVCPGCTSDFPIPESPALPIFVRITCHPYLLIARRDAIDEATRDGAEARLALTFDKIQGWFRFVRMTRQNMQKST
jgi:hypothetical protein